MRLPPKPSPALVVAVVALIVALGGTTYAAITLPPRSVGTKQLRDKAVKAKKIANDSIGSKKVKPNSLRGSDILESTLAKVPAAASADHALSATDAATLGDNTPAFYARASRIQFGTGNNKSVTQDTILEWPEASFQLKTDGDNDASPQVRVRNTNPAGQGDLLVIESKDGTQDVVTEGVTSGEYTGENAGRLELVIVSPGHGTMWVRCAFPAISGTPVQCLGLRSTLG